MKEESVEMMSGTVSLFSSFVSGKNIIPAQRSTGEKQSRYTINVFSFYFHFMYSAYKKFITFLQIAAIFQKNMEISQEKKRVRTSMPHHATPQLVSW